MKSTINYLLPITLMLLVFTGCKKNTIPPPITPAPAISAISPTSGLAGVQVTITGTDFAATAGDNTVKFNGATATVVSATASSIVVNTPAAGGTGAITVTTSGGTATGPVFTYLMAPTVTSISPTSALAGASVTIAGTNFDPTAASNTVKFNGTAATVTKATATQLTVTVPAGGTSGAITVTTSGGTATGPVFTYLALPAITSISPTSALAGATVLITGTNFDATLANDAVKFNGTAATVTKATTTQLTVTVPAAGSTGNVTVTTAAGTSNSIAFTYLTATAGPDVYVLGESTSAGSSYGYWKNSTFNLLPDCNSAYAMVGINSDVYIAGPAKSNTPTYWKNNTEIQLSNQQGFTFSVTKSGSDLYFLGAIGNTTYVWKNGVASPLKTTSTASIGGSNGGYYENNAIAVNNGDVYVVGAQSLFTSTVLKATIWKNGTPTDITDGVSAPSAWANAVCVSGSDVYVAGIEEIRDPVTNGIINRAPTLWKNGVVIPMSAPINSLFNTVYCILVVGSDVYVGGQYNGVATVWKNGAIINTSAYAVAENVSSMFLYNNTDLYFGGASSVSGENGYWKNGNFVIMNPGCGVASSTCAGTSAAQVISMYIK